MWKKIKKCLCVLAILLAILLAIAFPIIVNLLYCFKTPHEVLQAPKEWTVFWGTYISGIASFLMLLLTYRTLKENIKSSAPQVDFRIVKADAPNSFNLILKNTGKSIAKDVIITVELNSEKAKKHLDLAKCEMSPITIFPFEEATIIFLKEDYDSEHKISYMWGRPVVRNTYMQVTNDLVINESSLTITCKYDDVTIRREERLHDISNNTIQYNRINSNE